MYYKLKFHTIFRDFGEIGYLIYQRLPYDIDRVVNNIGSVFLSALSYEPQEIDELALMVASKFNNVSIEEVRNDMISFFNDLEEEGFIDSAVSFQKCKEKTDWFDYSKEDSYLPKVEYQYKSKRQVTQDFLEKRFSEKPRLMKFQIEITNVCNERCIHCYIPHHIKKQIMSEDLFYRILNQLKSMGIVSLGISGGEAMSHPKFKEFIKAVKELNVNISLLTNLTLLTDEIVSLFEKSRITVIPSLYSLNEEHHDYITQVKGSCKKTIEGILKLVEHSIPVEINCPIMNANKDDVIELIHWAKKKHIVVKTDNCIIARCDRSTDNLENRLSISDLERIDKLLIDENEIFKRVILADDYDQEVEKLFYDMEGRWCGVGVSCCCADAYGNVCPCPSWSDYNSGNLETESLEDIWLNSANFKYIRSLRKKDFPKCSVCEDKAYCSVCMAKNANESPIKNPLDVNDYFCKLSHINRETIENWRKNHLGKEGK